MKLRQEKLTTFDRYAGDYADLLHDPIRERFAAGNHFFFERKIQVICRFFKTVGIESRNLDWLDVGCGQGDMLRLGKPLFRSAAGCDPSEGMLQACAGLNVRKQESPKKLPFDDGHFDFLTAVCVYHHVPYGDRPRLTKEALRVLKPGGILCITEHNPWNIVTRIIVSRTRVDADANLLTPGETRRVLSNMGMEILRTDYFLLFPERIHRYVAPIEDGLCRFALGGQYSVFARRLA